jgi:hypothetical protein
VTVRQESDALHARVQRFISASLAEGPTEPFDALAMSIARFQAAHVAPVGRLSRARGVDLDGTRADVIPALPCDVFRVARVAAHPRELDARVFRTSGTSSGLRGEHPFRTTATYEMAALAWARRMLLPEGDVRIIALAQPESLQPDSSLAFMFGLFAAHLPGTATFHVTGDDLDVPGLLRACAEARADGARCLVLGTSFAFVHLLDRGPTACALPAGTRVMHTGGFKGRSREVEPRELVRSIARLFDVRESDVVAEYGMTELSSQLYEDVLREGSAHGLYRAPPWVRVQAADPATLELLSQGQVGIGRIVDLANVDSAVAIQTADRVRVAPDGAVELLGRAPGATPRGCSLAIDQVLGGS